jgi:hypothetical protein
MAAARKPAESSTSSSEKSSLLSLEEKSWGVVRWKRGFSQAGTGREGSS